MGSLPSSHSRRLSQSIHPGTLNTIGATPKLSMAVSQRRQIQRASPTSTTEFEAKRSDFKRNS